VDIYVSHVNIETWRLKKTLDRINTRFCRDDDEDDDDDYDDEVYSYMIGGEFSFITSGMNQVDKTSGTSY